MLLKAGNFPQKMFEIGMKSVGKHRFQLRHNAFPAMMQLAHLNISEFFEVAHIIIIL